MRHRKRRQNDIHTKNIQYIQDNKELIESGRHWNVLAHFAQVMLNKPEDIIRKFGSEKVVQNALEVVTNLLSLRYLVWIDSLSLDAFQVWICWDDPFRILHWNNAPIRKPKQR